jgi:hypothetical protein
LACAEQSNLKKVSRSNEREELPLAKAAEYLLDECRMVLPGIQALFGFQLIAVFNQGFAKLEASQRRIHLAALSLVAVAIALIMTPAAMHRIVHNRQVSAAFLQLSSRLLLASMLPLAAGICLDVYVITLIIASRAVALILSSGLFVLFLGLWFCYPFLLRSRLQLRAGQRQSG